MLRIVVTSGPEKGRSLDSEAMKSIEIGRKGKHLQLSDLRVSRVHCCLDLSDDGTWYLRDEKSKRGTKHNDRMVTGRVKIADGDRINLGHTVIRCFISKPMIAEPTPAPAPVKSRKPKHPAAAPEPVVKKVSVPSPRVQAAPKAKPAEKSTPPAPSKEKGMFEEAADVWNDAILSELKAFEDEEGSAVDDDSKV